MTPLRHLANQAVSSEYERLDGAEEGPGERRDDAGRFEVRTVAPSGLDGNASAEKRKAWLLRTYDLRSHLRKTRPKLAGEASGLGTGTTGPNRNGYFNAERLLRFSPDIA